MTFRTEIIGEDVLRAALRQLAERATDARPAMESVSQALLRETERIFDREGKGVGLARDWPALSEVTKHQRALAQSRGRQYGKNGKELASYANAKSGVMKILQVSGKLAASIQPVANAHEAGLTTNRVYAGTMFFGAKKGQFGRDRRNHPLPWGDIPGRVFFPVKAEGNDFALTGTAERSVLEILERYLEP